MLSPPIRPVNLDTRGHTPNPAMLRERWIYIDIPAIEYGNAWQLQGHLVSARKEKIIDANVVMLLEHLPVFTLGRRGGLNNLTVPEGFLKKAGIPVIQVERGGNITFHGPGQLVAYPIIELHTAGLRVTDYVAHLEEVMIRTAGHWGIKAERHPVNRGVWVGGKKLGSVGIAIRHGITFHGMAFNVNPSLEPFRWINPCGLQQTEMTSVERELSHKVSAKEARRAVKDNFQTVFGVELVRMPLSEVHTLLPKRESV